MEGERGKSHTHAVWLWENSLRAESLPAVRRRIFMGLEEGHGKTADKGRGEMGIGGQGEQGFQEGESGDLHGGKDAEPFLLLRTEDPQPPVQLGGGDGEPFTEPLHGGQAQEILRQDTQDKEKAIAGVGDDEIRQDGVGMAAGTDKAQDAEAVADGSAGHEVHQGTVIVGMDPAGALCPAAGTGLQFKAEVVHEGIKQVFG